MAKRQHRQTREGINDNENDTQVKILNLSTHQLSNAEKSVLLKGLKFTPTPKANPEQLKSDIKKFTRKLRLAEQFYSEEDSLEKQDKPLVRNKSSYNGKRGRNRVLDTYIDFLEKFPLEKDIRKTQNLTYRERTALYNLKSNKDIVIKEADKGHAVVIMNMEYYKRKVDSMLSDEQQYLQVDENSDSLVKQRIDTFIEKYSGELLDKEEDFVTNFKWNTATFYALPKIHKSEMIKRAIIEQKCSCVQIEDPEDLTFRPIVGGPNAPTQRLAQLMDIILKPQYKNIRSYIRDDIDFLNKLEKTVPNSFTLLTYDVCNLYGSIPHQLGLSALRFFINRHKEDLPRNFTPGFILDGTQLILENNIMKFGDKYFKQISGTAMGSKIGPVYANLCMGYLEHKLYARVEEVFNADIREYVESNWKRYLDDCYITFNNDHGRIDQFTEILNSLHEKIKFTIEKSDREIPFLDIMIIKQGNNLVTDLYQKPTDSKRYVHFTSSHPASVKRHIPFNLARRIATIVECKRMREDRFKDLEINLKRCGYPKRLIMEAINKYKDTDSSILRQKVVRPPKDIITFVHDYNPNNVNFKNIIKGSLPMLHEDDRMKSILEKNVIINSQKQPPNLKRMLCGSSIKKKTLNISAGKRVKKCGNKRCQICKIIIEGEKLELKMAKFYIPIMTLIVIPSMLYMY